MTAQAAYLTTDGDFGNQTNGVAIRAPWNSVVKQAYGHASSQSPFTNVFPVNAVGAYWNPTNQTDPYFGQAFADIPSNATGMLCMNTDFMLPGNSSGGFRLVVANALTSGLQQTLTIYVTHVGVYASSTNGIGTRILTAETGVWYNLQLSLDMTSNRYSGAITRADTSERTPIWGRSFAGERNISTIFADTMVGAVCAVANVGCRVDNWVLADSPLPAPPFLASYLSTNDISLYVPFEGTATAAIARGSVTGRVHGVAEYGEGKYGQGYLTGRDNPLGDGDEILYAVSNNIDSSYGTIAMWVKPLNWNDADLRWRSFFGVLEAPLGLAVLRLYKYFGNTPILWYAEQRYFQLARFSVGSPPPVWAPNVWTHLAASWAGPVMRLYLNGQHVGSDYTLTPTLLRSFGTWLYVGGASAESNQTPDTVMDEFYVFNRPLTEIEIATLHQFGSAAFSNSTPGLEAATSADYYPSTEQLKVRVTLAGRRPDQLTGMSHVVHVQTSTGSVTSIAPVTNVFVQPDVTVSQAVELETGEYRAYTEIVCSGQVAVTSISLFQVPSTNEWLGNTTGVPSGATPPDPWTTLEKNGQSVTYWGGTVHYQDSLFPTQICARGTDLLARPIRLSLTTNGVTHTEFESAGFTWTNVTGLAAEFCASGTLGGVSISATGRLEFDGFLWTTLSIPEQGGAAIEELKLEIPLIASVAKFQQGALYNGACPSSGLAATWSYPIRGQPFLWLGNEEIGLQWCIGDNYCYENGTNQQHQAELAMGPTEAVFTVRLVDPSAHLLLDRPLTYTFGLQTTPVKPFPANWRSYDLSAGSEWRPATGRGRPAVPSWRMWWQGWNTQNPVTRGERSLFGYPVPDPATCRTNLEAFLARDEKPFLYWDSQSIWRGAPEYAGWKSEWGPDNPPALHFDTAGGSMISNGFAYRTVSSYRDWATWRYHKSMVDNAYLTNIAGFYNDVAQGFWGTEPRINSNGMVTVKHEVLGVRELQKRMYVGMAEWPDKVILNHQSGDNHMSQLAFAHIYLNGEQYRPNEVDYGYAHILDFHSSLVELQGHKWGIPLMFLPEVPFGITTSNLFTSAKWLAAGEHLQGLLLMHDALLYGGNMHPLPAVRVAAMKELFGWDEQVEYIGYWKTSPTYLTNAADQAPVEVTVYRRPDVVAGHSVLFVVMNNSDTNATVTLTPNWTNLGVSPAPTTMVDAITAVGVPDAPVDITLLLQSNKLMFAEPRVYGPVLTVQPAEDGSYTFPVTNRGFRVLASDSHFGDDLATNGVPQRWLVQYYPGTEDWDEAALSDTDGDGMAAWEEYWADTDPSRAASGLWVTEIRPRESSGLDLYWSSRTTRTYAVHMTTNIAADWQLSPRTSNIPGSASGTNRYEDLEPPADRGYYRIRAE